MTKLNSANATVANNSGPFRLSGSPGLLTDASRNIEFQFEGKTYSGLPGDTVASAMAAHGDLLLSRSFKYHRPRGPLTMAGHDANTLVQAPGLPNALADRLEISAGMSVLGQNYSGSLKKDRNRWLGYLSGFLPVGFYYRAFYKPKGVWEYWARYFRKKAGLGRIDTAHRSTGFDKQYLHCDVIVVGGGPAGLLAALSAGQSQQKVLLIDENKIVGGSFNYARADNAAQQELQASLIRQVQDCSCIQIISGATVNGWYADNWLPVIKGKRLYKVRAQRVILASGTLEQPAIFHNNDLPGIMMSTAAQRLLKLYGVKPGQRAVVLTANSNGYATALDLLDAGVSIVAIVDLREEASGCSHAAALAGRGVEIRYGSTVYAAQPDRAGNRLAQVEIRMLNNDGQVSEVAEHAACDVLCVAVGYMPCYQLACQAGATLNYDDDRARFEITNLPANLAVIGSANGSWSWSDCVADIHRALPDANLDPIKSLLSSVDDSYADSKPNHPWPIFTHPKGKEFVDLDEDLTIADIRNAVDDGYDDVQLTKRFSTCGMGPSQGRHSALAMARLVAKQTGKTVAQTGVTTARPPFAPELIAHCAGQSFYPIRRTSLHQWHVNAGAQFMHAGLWLRPAWYGGAAEKAESINREVLAVRERVGMVDVSTLGGFELRGADAGEFMDRMYTMKFSGLQNGKARYALMLNESGVTIDDGVACRFAEDHFYVTATTSGADRIYRLMLQWQARWQLDLDISNVTSAFCGINIAGPQSREVLQEVCDISLSATDFPYMAVRVARIGKIPVRLLRVGFVGELGFEIHAPQQYGPALWQRLMEAGSGYQIAPFGVEAQRVLRLEKGHIIIGQDTDAMCNPMELDMAWALSKIKPFYLGQRTIAELKKMPLTRLLVGFEVDEDASDIPKENHLIVAGGEIIGRATSSAWSPTMQRAIGLGFVPPSQQAPGTKLTIRCEGGQLVDATVVSLPFYDAGNHRQDMQA